MNGILAIDSASPAGVALAYRAEAGGDVVTFAADGPQDHSRQLIPAIERVVGDVRGLRAIGVASGPGSYAGLRVGIATAESLGLGLGVAVYGVRTFEAAARAAGIATGALVHPAGRGEFALQRFTEGTADGAPSIATAGDLPADSDLAGEGAGGLGGREVGRGERAAAIIEIVEARLAVAEAPAGIDAYYLREPSVTRPKRTPLAPGGRGKTEYY